MTNRPILPKNEELLFQKILPAFFTSLSQSEPWIDTVLQRFKDLRREYVSAIKNEVLFSLMGRQEKGTTAQKLEGERLESLLSKLMISLRQEQEKSYHFIEERIGKEILERLSRDCWQKSLQQISELSEEEKAVKAERDRLLDQCERLQEEVLHWKEKMRTMCSECASLKKAHMELTEKASQTAKDLHDDSDRKEALRDYETILGEIRKDLEGKKSYDLWRLKVFYNRVAALTNSTWEYSGVPKPDPYQPKSLLARKFFKSL